MNWQKINYLVRVEPSKHCFISSTITPLTAHGHCLVLTLANPTHIHEQCIFYMHLFLSRLSLHFHRVTEYFGFDGAEKEHQVQLLSE